MIRLMRKGGWIVLLIIGLHASFLSVAQRKLCGTPTPATPFLIDTALAQQLKLQNTYPLLVKVFVHITAYDHGGGQAQDEEDVMAHLQTMRDYFAPANICFILAGMEVLKNNAMNSTFFDPESSSDEDTLKTFLVPGAINIFVHSGLEGYLGYAYNIPNRYLSVLGSYTWPGNQSLAAHEMGHCLGLYHTFETWDDTRKERVARGGNCKNCEAAGDMLCDTEADLESVTLQSCAYAGSLTDSCGNTYLMTPNNVMSYHDDGCITHFTTGQAGRMQNVLLTNSSLNATLAEDSYSRTLNLTISSGRYNLAYRNTILIDAPTYQMTDGARVNMTSREITIRPGVTFSPSGDGYTTLRANTLCQ